jgi:hypothetical protein
VVARWEGELVDNPEVPTVLKAAVP